MKQKFHTSKQQKQTKNQCYQEITFNEIKNTNSSFR